MELVGLQELIQINAEEFEGNALYISYHVFSKYEVIDEMHHTVRVLRVFFSQITKDLYFYHGLFVEPALVSDDLQG